MRKISILKRKIIRAYKNPKNWEYSEQSNYIDSFFGYTSLNEVIKSIIKGYRLFYGKGLKKVHKLCVIIKIKDGNRYIWLD